LAQGVGLTPQTVKLTLVPGESQADDFAGRSDWTAWKAVAERLLQDAVAFRAACRNIAKAKWLIERGVDVVAVDLESPTGLRTPWPASPGS
jgi:hypothetical protein